MVKLGACLFEVKYRWGKKPKRSGSTARTCIYKLCRGTLDNRGRWILWNMGTHL